MANTARTQSSTHAAPHTTPHAAPLASCRASWRPAAWLWLLLVLPGLLASGTASALHNDGPTGQRSLDHPAMALARDLPGHLLAQPSGDADDTSALSATLSPGGVPPRTLRTPLPLPPAQARDRQRYPGSPRAPPSLI